MKKYKIITAILLGTLLSAESQDLSSGTGIDNLIKNVLEKNPVLVAAREQFRVSMIDAGTGNTPPDPQVEFGYLFGNPRAEGNRIDFSVSQQFDFPTIYIHRSRLRKVKSDQAELRYVSVRQEILLVAYRLWIERIYLNRQEKLLSYRLEKAETMLEQFRQKLFSGEEGKLLFSQSNLQTVALRNEYDRTVAQININHLALEEISGSKLEPFDLLVFPPSPPVIPDSLLKDYEFSTGKQLHIREFELKQQQQKLVQSNYLPRLTAGYYSETVLDQKFKGFQVGFTVPLWENVNTVKHAKSEVLYAEAESDRFSSNQKKELLQKLDQHQSIIRQLKNLEGALSVINDEELLSLALESGEISFTEYMYASELYFRNMQSLLLYKRDRLFLETELMKIYF